jgi:hypothetical protein
LNSLIITDSIQSGLTYQLRYRAHSVNGWGDFSPIASILAATIPGATSEPETTNQDTDIKVSWTAPLNSGGDNVAITSYQVDIFLVSGDYVEACLVIDLFCLIQMEDLLLDPYYFS